MADPIIYQKKKKKKKKKAEPIMLQAIKSSVYNSNFLYEFSSFVSMNLHSAFGFSFMFPNGFW
jgi:hypothetical protein